jgi:hypothetical protein
VAFVLRWWCFTPPTGRRPTVDAPVMMRKTTMLLLASMLAFWAAPGSAQDTVTLGKGDVPSPIARPDVYMVQPGDTLWDISTRFLGDAKFWPLLWSINDYITNPHWIYPGNRIIFVPGTEIEPPGISLEGGTGREGYEPPITEFTEVGLKCGPDMRFEAPYPNTLLHAPGLLEDNEKLTILGSLYKARTGQTDFADDELIYLELHDPHAVECGDVVSIYRRIKRKVKFEGERFGGMYRVIGDARILLVQDDIATAQIRKSYFEARRGDVIGPRMPVDVELPVESSKGNLNGNIVARLQSDEALYQAYGATVFIDRGKADGVRVGNTFYVVESRDQHEDLKHEDLRLPPSVIGRVVVVRVDERSATAVVVDASRPIDVGNRLMMRLD